MSKCYLDKKVLLKFKGISLKLNNWELLKKLAPIIDKAIKILDWMNID